MIADAVGQTFSELTTLLIIAIIIVIALALLFLETRNRID